MKIQFARTFLFLSILLPQTSHAWGKRGHTIVCETAAYLLTQEKTHSEQTGFLKSHSFDLGYYCNVPDIVWKRPDTYKIEFPNHFMDMEIFERSIKDPKERVSAFQLSRIEFNEKYPQILESAGRSFWRVRELVLQFESLTKKLRDQDPRALAHEQRMQRQSLQADWLTLAGVVGHYVADLAQPLHVTENYDGQLTGQKGLHEWFETELVNDLYLEDGNSLSSEVLQKAKAQWNSVKAKGSGDSHLKDDLPQLAKDSLAQMEKILKIDSKWGRKDRKKARKIFRPILSDRLAAGAVALAKIWQTQLGWTYDGERFYIFLSDPPYMVPPQAKPATDSTPKSQKNEH